jgi:hypothetical protein
MIKIFRMIKDLFSSDRKYDKSMGLTLTTILMTVGIIGIVLISFASEKYPTGLSLSNLSVSLLFSLASLLSGAFLGFLFGIPRSLQKTQSIPSAESQTFNTNSSFADNTNLEQISDWLTKIIVGVSLTQMDKLGPNLHSIAQTYASGLYGLGNTALPFAYAVIIFYSIAGFLYSYLWTRINLKTALNEMDELRGEISQARNDASQARNDASQTVNELNEVKKAQFEREKAKIAKDEKSSPDIAEIISLSKPNPPSVFDDPQKGRWGGNALNNKRQLSAIVSAIDDTNYNVKLIVKTTSEDAPLVGLVYFFIHDTYDSSVLTVEAFNNEAICEIESYEAFTVGAVCDEGKTKLELDLNQEPNVPVGYKYL